MGKPQALEYKSSNSDIWNKQYQSNW
jgi:hypothetical protein